MFSRFFPPITLLYQDTAAHSGRIIEPLIHVSCRLYFRLKVAVMSVTLQLCTLEISCSNLGQKTEPFPHFSLFPTALSGKTYLRPYFFNSFFTNHSATLVYRDADSIVKLTKNKYGNEVIIFDVIMIVLENESIVLYCNNGVKMVYFCGG